MTKLPLDIISVAVRGRQTQQVRQTVRTESNKSDSNG